MDSRTQTVIKATDALLQKKSRIIIGIDGAAASGKTTLAQGLAAHYGCPVIHMDHFFLPVEKRTEQRYAEPGGNIHYERFLDEVITGINSGKAFSYRIFNCCTLSYDGTAEIKPSDILIIEGSYSLHPKWSDIFDLKVWLTVDSELQKERIKKRNGEAMLHRFTEFWIPLESLYSKTLDLEPCLIL